MPPARPGRHRGEPSPGERQAERRTRVRQGARTTVRAPRTVATAVTVRRGGQHALMAEFLAFTGIVALRAIADYVPGEQGQPTEGTSKGAITPRGSQPGPLATLAAGFVIFFILGFMAARGGTSARVAAMAGLIVDVVLLMNSLPELNTVSKSFGNVRANAQAQAEATIQPVGYQGTAPGPYGG